MVWWSGGGGWCNGAVLLWRGGVVGVAVGIVVRGSGVVVANE